MSLIYVSSSPRYVLSSFHETYKIASNFPRTSTSVLPKMRCNALFFLVTSPLVSLVKSLSLGSFDEVGLFDADSYNDAPIDLGEPATFLAEADLNFQPVGESIFPAFSGSSEDLDDLFENQDHFSFSSFPEGGSTNSDALFALSPSPDSSDQMQAGLLSSHTDSETNETPVDFGESLDNFINEGLNNLLHFTAPLDKECDQKTVGRVPLCCNSRRKELPFAYGCKPFSSLNLDCQFFNYQFCCLGYNPIDNEGVSCTKGFYVP